MAINEKASSFRRLAGVLSWMVLAAPAAAASVTVLADWEAFDAVVASRYASAGSEVPMYPPARLSFMLCETPRPFDPDGFAGLTNTISPSYLTGEIPAWRLRVVETQLTCRAWVVYAGNRAIRTNAVPPSFDVTQWVDATFGDHPAWLSGAALALWYQERERNRLVAQYLLIPADRYGEYQAMLAAARTNTVPRVSGPVVPADTNRVAFARVVSPASQTIDLDLYAPASLPIDIFWRNSLPVTSVWHYAGTVQAVHPFTPAALPRHGPQMFLNAARADIDTDGDGIPDGLEILGLGTDPNLWDTDGDGLSDHSEVYRYGTDPNRVDTDSDGYTDQQEVNAGFDPNRRTNVVGAESLDLRLTLPGRR